MSHLVVMPSGEPVDPIYVSLSNLCRMGDNEFRACMEYVTTERERRAEVAAEREAVMAEARAEIHADVERRHKAQKEYADAHPWTK